MCSSEETTLLLIYLTKALEIFFEGNSDDFNICHPKFNEYFIVKNHL